MKVALVIVSIVAVLAVAGLVVVLATGLTITDDEAAATTTAASGWTNEEARWFVDRCSQFHPDEASFSAVCYQEMDALQQKGCTSEQALAWIAAQIGMQQAGNNNAMRQAQQMADQIDEECSKSLSGNP